jgi:hypothetical protein
MFGSPADVGLDIHLQEVAFARICRSGRPDSPGIRSDDPVVPMVRWIWPELLVRLQTQDHHFQTEALSCCRSDKEEHDKDNWEETAGKTLRRLPHLF